MSSNGFSFAVRIGREVDNISFLGGGDEFFDDFFLLWKDRIGRFEIVFYVDAEFFFGEVADMTERGLKRVFIIDRAQSHCAAQSNIPVKMAALHINIMP